MPPFVLGNAVQVRLIWDLNGRSASNVLGGQVGGGFVNSQAHADALATAVLGRFTSSGLKARTGANFSLSGVGIRDLRVANQAEYLNTSAPVAGTGTADPLPTQLAGVVTLRTALAGKSYRGRVYIAGADEDQSDSTGRIDAAYNTAIDAFITGVAADMATEGITLAVLSRPRTAPPFPVAWGGAVTPVTSITTRDTSWDTQRRRGL
jgi:hypothetical protein